MDIHNLSRRICDEIGDVLAAVGDESAERLMDAIVRSHRIFLTGTGRSGWVARCLAVRLGHLGRTLHVVGDATTPAIVERDLLLACTGSGSTPSVLGYVDGAHRAGATVAVITARPDSTAAQRADVVVHLPAPTPKAAGPSEAQSIQPMGSLFEQSLLIFGDALIMLLADRLEQDHDQMWQRHTNLE